MYIKEKKRKVAIKKKVGRKFAKKRSKKNSRNSLRDKENLMEDNDTTMDKLDKNIGDKGADTLNTNVKKKKETETKKKKTTVWLNPKRTPTTKEQRRLFGKALEIMLITCMNNHVYQFNNQYRIQKQGGPIGLKLTGEIADCVMIDWDNKLLAKLKNSEIAPEIYTRFKDDIQIVTESLEKGSVFTEESIIVDEKKKEEDENISDTKVTMGVVQTIANAIDPMIQLTVETPCNSDDGKMAVLDLKVKINPIENNRIEFEFFEKPTNNPRVILSNSAMSFSQKRTILTQECLRRLRNTKIELGVEVQKIHLDRYMLKLKNSGYSQKFRTEILNSAFKAFQKMKDDDKSGIKPMYRSREWNQEERTLMKAKKKVNWWNTDKSTVQYKSVLFVTPTPGGVLAKELQKREAELNRNTDERIKIVEKGGLKIKDILGAKDPFKKSNCSEKTCPLCTESEFIDIQTEERKISCRANNVGYRWLCVTCKEKDIVKVYEGETGRSARLRGSEHLKDLEKKRDKSVLYRHKLADHPHEEVKFKMEITKKFKDALTRQANEAVRIYTRPSHETLNNKSEFNHPPLNRVVVEKRKKISNLRCGKQRQVS